MNTMHIIHSVIRTYFLVKPKIGCNCQMYFTSGRLLWCVYVIVGPLSIVAIISNFHLFYLRSISWRFRKYVRLDIEWWQCITLAWVWGRENLTTWINAFIYTTVQFDSVETPDLFLFLFQFLRFFSRIFVKLLFANWS